MRMVADFVRIALRLAIGLAAALAVVVPAGADDITGSPALDELFVELAHAPDPMIAHNIDQKIWAIWTQPTDPVLAGRMNEVLAARGMGDPVEAIALLDKLIDDYPGYAEAWNQRATMYYALGNFEASIADCAKVLELEPRHFGALSGRAIMYLQLGKRALALKDMAVAIKIHPFLSERQLFPELEQQKDVTRI
jgi:tetratricopeptide (TPR) repeat protein